MTTTTVNLVPASKYERETYGILLVSETEHDFVGRGIHNRHHGHILQVWENKPLYIGDEAERFYRDPRGGTTPERFSYLWSPQAVVISAHPGKNVEQGEPLALGDTVTVAVHGYPLGDFTVAARSLHNPHLERIES
jgi:hypothetical protein